MRLCYLIAAILTSVLVSCVTESAPEFYRPVGSVKRLEIFAKHEPWEGINGTVYVFIDGEEVVKKSIPLFTGNALEAKGEWRGKPVRVSIVKINTLVSNYHRCDVFIDGEHASTLTI